MSNKITDAKKQLEKLVSCQAAWEKFLHELTVRVSLNVHSAENSAADLLDLFEAGLSSPDFDQARTSRTTWIRHKSLEKNVAVFMPKDFDADELYPEPKDDEGYNQAVEYTNARKHNDQGMQELDDRMSDSPVTDYMP